jgi:DNA-binding CsgD family transcriptional regulator
VEQVFVGRESELAAISARIAAVTDGHPALVWIEGDAGVGKSALLRRVRDSLPDDAVVLTGEADEHTREVAYSVANQLGAVTSNSPWSVAMELLDVVGGRSDSRPVVLIVEDMHWADVGSRAALLMMFRRLDTDRVALLCTSRPTDDTDGWQRVIDDENHCCTIRLGAISEQQVADWARCQGKPLSVEQAARLHRHTGGHPLYIKTLLNELSVAQLSAQELPAPRSLSAATITALDGVPDDASRLAGALAVLGTRTPLSVAARVAAVAAPTDALEALLHTGLVYWSPAELDTPIDFTHPLYRRAVYDALTPTQRRRLHRTAADTVGRVAGWPHRVAAADTGDDVLADELERGAEEEAHRGALGIAAKYLLWAAPLTSKRNSADDRLLRGARHLLADGQLDRVGDLLPMLESTEPGPLRDSVLGGYAYEMGDTDRAKRLLSGVGSCDDADASVRAYALLRLSSIYLLAGEPREQAAAAEAALSMDGHDSEIARSAWGSLASAESALRGPAAGLAVLARRLPDQLGDVDDADAELLAVRGLLKLYAADTRAGAEDLRAAIRSSRQGFSGQHLPAAHTYLARALFITGDWDEALVHARAAAAIVADGRHDWMRGRVEFVVGTIAASRGQWDDAQEALRHVQEAATARADTTWAEMLVRVLRSALCRARLDPTGVVDALRPLASDARIVVSQMAVVTWWPVLIEGLIESGQLDDAAAELARFASHVDGTGMALVGQLLGLRARLAAAAGDADVALPLFASALEAIRPDDGLIDRGLLRHRYGRLLHARGNRRDAVRHLRGAHELFASVGAEPYRRAVADDLTWCGIGTPSRQSRSPLDFTEREQDVVALVRKGLTNKEVAAQMYVSEKAVEYHLRNVYGKLGIRSRRELRAHS